MYRLPAILALLATICAITVSAQRWEAVSLPAPYDDEYYLDIYFLPSNPNLGWACGEYHGYVVRTTDGGKSWRGAQVADGCHLEYVQFLDANVGYTSGPCGAYKSTDGGVTWTAITPALNAQPWGAWFRNANEGWLLGGGCGVNRFYRTGDGGQSWIEYVDSTNADCKLADPLWQADMATGILYAIGSGILWRSLDDGLTWEEFSVTGTSRWHEELTRSGNSFVIPSSGNDCNGIGTGGDLRFSVNGGTTWTAFQTGKPMFGAHLLNTTTAWGAGQQQAVYYTDNSGTSWELRNCGVSSNTDDVFFINDTTGWVVGDSLWRYSKPKRLISDTVLSFGLICPDQYKRDTVTVTNLNFFQAPVFTSLSGTDVDQFRIIGTVPPSVAVCGSLPIIIEYRPTRRGPHVAYLTVALQNPSETKIVELNGNLATSSAKPSDTLIVLRHRVGTPAVTNTIVWNATNPPYETIMDITRVSGDTSISVIASVPLRVQVPAQMTFTATARDTGWYEARFKMLLAPCGRDTFITVRVYGETPIFSSISNVVAAAACAPEDTVAIPILNTGNAPLLLTNVQFTGPGRAAYSIIGWSSGRPNLLLPIRAGESDTAFIRYAPITSDDRATLVIDHDDLSTARGVKRPWNIQLFGSTLLPDVTVSTTALDLGTICIGSVASKRLKVMNTGAGAAQVWMTCDMPNLSGIPVLPFALQAPDSAFFDLRYTGVTSGSFIDTVTLRVTPCDSFIRVVVTVRVESGRIELQPRSINAIVPNGSVTRHRAVIRVQGAPSLVISSLRLTPSTTELEIDSAATLPYTLTSTDSSVVWLRYVARNEQSINARLHVTATGNCASADSIPISLRSTAQNIVIDRDTFTVYTRCTPRDTIIFFTLLSQSPLSTFSVGQPTVAESSPGTFTVLQPSAYPVDIPPSGSLTFQVRVSQTTPGGVSGSVRIPVEPGGRSFIVSINSRYERTSLRATTTAIDFGTQGSCSPDTSVVYWIHNDGDVNETLQLQRPSPTPAFTIGATSLTVQPRDSVQVTVSCLPPVLQGKTVEVFTFVGQICGDVLPLECSADLDGSRLVVTPSRIDYGQREVGTSLVRQFMIINPSQLARRITSVTVQQPAATFRLLTDPSGQWIQSDDTITVDVRFEPSAAGMHTARVVVVDSAICVNTSSVELQGDAQVVVPPSYIGRVVVDEYSVKPNERVTIPVRWTRDVSAAGVDSIDVNISFAFLNLKVDSVYSDYPGAAVNAEIAEGLVRLHATRTGPEIGRAGTLATLTGIAMPVLPDSTILDVNASTVWSIEKTTMEEEDGILLVDACGPRFMITLNNQTRAVIQPPHPIEDVFSVQLDAMHDDEVLVEFINSVGERVHHDRVHVQRGRTVSQFVLPEAVSSGLYVIRLRAAHGEILTAARLVVRRSSQAAAP
jgi:photosystem II stability/assembly factor-like uncharacterized protein